MSTERKSRLSNGVALLLAQGIIGLVRLLLPVLEFFASSPKKQRLRELRDEMNRLSREGKQFLNQVERDPRGAAAALDDFLAKSGDPELQERMRGKPGCTPRNRAGRRSAAEDPC